MTMKPTSTRSTAAVALLALLGGCGSNQETTSEEFHTSGSREADQRAEQRISKAEQMRGEGEGGAKGVVQATLYERLGGQKGLETIVADFVERVVQDPRVNWERKGIKRGGVLGVGARSAEWSPTPERMQALRAHLVQFLSLATGGPARYEGRDMKAVHEGMKITNAELDSAIGDMKATLDKLRVANQEQKELLAILESARPQVAELR